MGINQSESEEDFDEEDNPSANQIGREPSLPPSSAQEIQTISLKDANVGVQADDE